MPFALSLSKGPPPPTAPARPAHPPTVVPPLPFASFLRRQESRGAGCGNPTQNLQAAPLPPPSFPLSREPRAGARCGAPPALVLPTPANRRTGESRYPEVRRAAARPHQPTSQARFAPSPFALSLSKGPSTTTSPRASHRSPNRRSREGGNPGQGRDAGPSPTLIPTRNTLTRPHCPHAVPLLIPSSHAPRTQAHRPQAHDTANAAATCAKRVGKHPKPTRFGPNESYLQRPVL